MERRNKKSKRGNRNKAKAERNSNKKNECSKKEKEFEDNQENSKEKSSPLQASSVKNKDDVTISKPASCVGFQMAENIPALIDDSGKSSSEYACAGQLHSAIVKSLAKELDTKEPLNSKTQENKSGRSIQIADKVLDSEFNGKSTLKELSGNHSDSGILDNVSGHTITDEVNKDLLKESSEDNSADKKKKSKKEAQMSHSDQKVFCASGEEKCYLMDFVESDQLSVTEIELHESSSGKNKVNQDINDFDKGEDPKVTQLEELTDSSPIDDCLREGHTNEPVSFLDADLSQDETKLAKLEAKNSSLADKEKEILAAEGDERLLLKDVEKDQLAFSEMKLHENAPTNKNAVNQNKNGCDFGVSKVSPAEGCVDSPPNADSLKESCDLNEPNSATPANIKLSNIETNKNGSADKVVVGNEGDAICHLRDVMDKEDMLPINEVEIQENVSYNQDKKNFDQAEVSEASPVEGCVDAPPNTDSLKESCDLNEPNSSSNEATPADNIELSNFETNKNGSADNEVVGNEGESICHLRDVMDKDMLPINEVEIQENVSYNQDKKDFDQPEVSKYGFVDAPPNVDNYKICQDQGKVTDGNNPSKKGKWVCMDPGCKSLNEADITSCIVCKLPKSFTSVANQRIFKENFKPISGKKKTRSKRSEYIYNNMEEYTFINFVDSKLYLRNKQAQIDFPSLKNLLQKYYECSKLNIVNTFNYNKMYGAQINGEFQRVMLKQRVPSLCKGDEQTCLFNVELVDTGYTTVIHQDYLHPLDPQFQSISPLVMPFYLNNVEFHEGNNIEVLMWLKERLKDKVLTTQRKYSTVNRSTQEIMSYVNLYEGSHLINREVAEKGFGKSKTSSRMSITDEESKRQLCPGEQKANNVGSPSSSLCTAIESSNDMGAPPSAENKGRELEKMSSKLKELHERRVALQPYISDKGILIRAIQSLLEDSQFHSAFDYLIQQGIDCQASVDNPSLHDQVKRFQEMTVSLDVQQKAVIIRDHKAQLELLLSDIINVDNHGGSLSLSTLDPSPYNRILNDFLLLKQEYVSSEAATDEAVECVATCLDQHSVFLRSVLQMRDRDPPPSSSGVVGKVFKAMDVEETLGTKGSSSLRLTCEAILKELSSRLFKVKKVEVMQGVNPQTIPEPFSALSLNEESKSTTQYPSLLHFISQSRSMAPQTKCMIIKDLVQALESLHARGECYGLLTPENVMISDGAVLCPSNGAFPHEPIPPFKFFAPECGKDASSSPSHVGPPADCYSLGQLIMWLALVEKDDDDFVPFLMEVRKGNPVLKALSARDPSQRPSLHDLKTCLPRIFFNVFGVRPTVAPVAGREVGSARRPSPIVEEEEEVSPQSFSPRSEEQSASPSVGEEDSPQSTSPSLGEEESFQPASLSVGEEESLQSTSPSLGEEESPQSVSPSLGEEESLQPASLSVGEEESTPSSSPSVGEEDICLSTSLSVGEEEENPQPTSPSVGEDGKDEEEEIRREMMDSDLEESLCGKEAQD